MRNGELTTGERGYGAEHKRLRALSKAVVESGEGWCTAAVCLFAKRANDNDARWVPPGADDCAKGCRCPRHWDLGHLPDRSGYAGIQHSVCNRSEAGRRGNPRRKPAQEKREPRQPTWRPDRMW